MPGIELLENLSKQVALRVPGGTPTLSNYLQTGLTFAFSLANSQFGQIQNTKISDIDTDKFPVTLAANGPGSFKFPLATLNVKGGGSASIDLLKGDKAEDFSKTLHLPGPAPAFAAFGFTASVEGGPSGTTGDVSLGVTYGQSITITNYCRTSPSGLFGDALSKAMSGLTIPHTIDDLRKLPEGNVCRLEGTGTLKFSASFQYSLFTNVLASEPIELISQSLSIKAHSGPTLQIAVDHTNTHQLTIAALGNNTIRLAAGLGQGADIQGGLDFSIGVSANIGSFDGLSFLMQHISPSPDTEIKKLRDALPAAAQANLSGQIQKVLQGCVGGGITASLNEALKASLQRDHLFVYDVALDALDDASTRALQAALRGDFTELTAKGSALAGITEVDNVTTLTLGQTQTLTVHLIGILNFSDVSSFVQRSQVALSKDSGDLVLTSSEVAVLENNIDPDHLREVLLRSAVITAAAASSPANPDFTFKMVFFLRKARLSRSDLQQFSNVLQAVSSPNAPAARALLNGPTQTLSDAALYLSLNLNKQTSLSVFRNRTSDDFVLAGQNALKIIFANAEECAGRLPLASKSLDFWKELQDTGNRPDILRLLQANGVPDPAAVVDFYSVDWWAEAMGSVSKALAKNEPLRDAEKDALKKSEGGFNIPWALLATYLLAGSPQVDSKFAIAASGVTQALGARGI